MLARELFLKAERAFSSGCIRLEHPEALAAYVLASHPTWDAESVAAAVQNDKTFAVRIPEPVPLHLVYLATWVDKSGAVQFRKDIYGRDARLLEALTAAAAGRAGKIAGAGEAFSASQSWRLAHSLERRSRKTKKYDVLSNAYQRF